MLLKNKSKFNPKQVFDWFKCHFCKTQLQSSAVFQLVQTPSPCLPGEQISIQKKYVARTLKIFAARSPQRDPPKHTDASFN